MVNLPNKRVSGLFVMRNLKLGSFRSHLIRKTLGKTKNIIGEFMKKKRKNSLIQVTIFLQLMLLILSTNINATETLPTVEQVLENYTEALGGRKAIEKLSTRVCSGYLVKDVHWKTPAFDVVEIKAYAKSPNKVMIKYFEHDGEEIIGYDGKNGWRKTTDGVFENEHLNEPKLSWILIPQNVLNIEKFYSELKITGIEQINGRQAYSLEPAGLEKGNYGLYFDIKTNLLIGIGYHYEILDYQEVDGVMFPFRIIQGRKGGSYTYKFKKVTHNEKLSDSIFNKPEE